MGIMSIMLLIIIIFNRILSFRRTEIGQIEATFCKEVQQMTVKQSIWVECLPLSITADFPWRSLDPGKNGVPPVLLSFIRQLLSLLIV